MQEIRAFIALELPIEIKSTLSSLLDRLNQDHPEAVKWVNPDGIHLTLKFLGNIPFSQVTKISDVLAESAREYSAMELELKGLGAFPNLRAPRVVWMGVDGDVPRITQLQKRVDEGMVALGFPSEKRVFSPHLTLGRVREGAVSRDRQKLSEAVGAFRLPRTDSFAVDRISLIKSTLDRRGAIYETLATFSLDRIQSE